MSVIQYTKRMFVERIRRHVTNGFPNDDYSASEREVMLYLDSALAAGMIGQVYANAKVEGNLVMPEAYVTRYALTALQQDSVTGEWYSTLPQTPVNLPLGYSITNAFFSSSVYGVSDPILPIRNKRVAYRKFMPSPSGSSYRVDSNIIYVQASNSQPLLGLNLYVEMAKSRTDDLNEIMSLPDDAMEAIFMNVVQKLTSRYQEPKDIVLDELPAGNKSS